MSTTRTFTMSVSFAKSNDYYVIDDQDKQQMHFGGG